MTIQEKELEVGEIHEPKKEKIKRHEKIIEKLETKCILNIICQLNNQTNFAYNKDEPTIIIFNTDYFLNNPTIITRILETISSNTNTIY